MALLQSKIIQKEGSSVLPINRITAGSAPQSLTTTIPAQSVIKTAALFGRKVFYQPICKAVDAATHLIMGSNLHQQPKHSPAPQIAKSVTAPVEKGAEGGTLAARMQKIETNSDTHAPVAETTVPDATGPSGERIEFRATLKPQLPRQKKSLKLEEVRVVCVGSKKQAKKGETPDQHDINGILALKRDTTLDTTLKNIKRERNRRANEECKRKMEENKRNIELIRPQVSITEENEAIQGALTNASEDL